MQPGRPRSKPSIWLIVALMSLLPPLFPADLPLLFSLLFPLLIRENLRLVSSLKEWGANIREQRLYRQPAERSVYTSPMLKV
jgi:hypothetical protein